jgi:hypothetical protein
MIIVGVPYSEKGLTYPEDISGGAPYGQRLWQDPMVRVNPAKQIEHCAASGQACCGDCGEVGSEIKSAKGRRMWPPYGIDRPKVSSVLRVAIVAAGQYQFEIGIFPSCLCS